MDTLFGLPAHPFLVHIPIVLLPLSAIGVVLMALRPRWHRTFRWVVLAIGTVGVMGAALAASAGEEFAGQVVAVQGRRAAASWQHHAELGDTTRSVALVYFVVLALFVFVPWWLERRIAAQPATTVGAAARTPAGAPWHRWAVVGVTVLALAGAAGSVASVIAAGHTGSSSVWQNYVKQTGGR